MALTESSGTDTPRGVTCIETPRDCLTRWSSMQGARLSACTLFASTLSNQIESLCPTIFQNANNLEVNQMNIPPHMRKLILSIISDRTHKPMILNFLIYLVCYLDLLQVFHLRAATFPLRLFLINFYSNHSKPSLRRIKKKV